MHPLTTDPFEPIRQQRLPPRRQAAARAAAVADTEAQAQAAAVAVRETINAIPIC